MEHQQNTFSSPQNNQMNTGMVDQNPAFANTPPPNNFPSQAPSKSGSDIVDKAEQLIIFTYFFIAAILFFRFLLSLFGAKRTSPFVDFVYQLTSPFMIPFDGMFGRTPGVGSFRLEFEVLVALAVYALVMFGLSRLVRIIFK